MHFSMKTRILRWRSLSRVMGLVLSAVMLMSVRLFAPKVKHMFV